MELRKRKQASRANEGISVERFLDLADGCQRLVVFTGSGISAASGMSMFSTRNGLYERARKKFKIQDGIKLFTYSFYKQRRTEVQAFFAQIYSEAQASRAADGHHSLAEVLELGRLQRHYTLNIDGLSEVVGMDTWHHERNPTGSTVEMHGNIRQLVCPSCQAVEPLSRTCISTLKAQQAVRCRACDADDLRFKVMLYDDDEGDCITPEHVFDVLEEDLKVADMVLWVGISFQQSASVEYFRKVRTLLGTLGRLKEVPQVLINPSDEPYFNIMSAVSNADDLNLIDVRATSDEAFPALADRLRATLGGQTGGAGTSAAGVVHARPRAAAANAEAGAVAARPGAPAAAAPAATLQTLQRAGRGPSSEAAAAAPAAGRGGTAVGGGSMGRSSGAGRSAAEPKAAAHANGAAQNGSVKHDHHAVRSSGGGSGRAAHQLLSPSALPSSLGLGGGGGSQGVAAALVSGAGMSAGAAALLGALLGAAPAAQREPQPHGHSHPLMSHAPLFQGAAGGNGRGEAGLGPSSLGGLGSPHILLQLLQAGAAGGGGAAGGLGGGLGGLGSPHQAQGLALALLQAQTLQGGVQQVQLQQLLMQQQQQQQQQQQAQQQKQQQQQAQQLQMQQLLLLHQQQQQQQQQQQRQQQQQQHHELQQQQLPAAVRPGLITLHQQLLHEPRMLPIKQEQGKELQQQDQQDLKPCAAAHVAPALPVLSL